GQVGGGGVLGEKAARAGVQRRVGHPLHAYAQVPSGYAGDATAAIVDRIEEFAPGFASRVVASTPLSAAQLAAANPNFAGGDILTGAKTATAMVFGPRPGGNRYATGISGAARPGHRRLTGAAARAGVGRLADR